MKWETLKERVAETICYGLERGAHHQGHVALFTYANRMATGASTWESIQELCTEVRRIVANWDIRMVGKLRELYPDQFPSNLRQGPLIAEMNDKGDWIVLPKP